MCLGKTHKAPDLPCTAKQDRMTKNVMILSVLAVK